jgi:hypothetical protein
LLSTDRRVDPHPEVFQLLENCIGTPDLVPSAISQYAEDASVAERADGVELAASRCVDERSASSQDRMGALPTSGYLAKSMILAAAVQTPRRMN